MVEAKLRAAEKAPDDLGTRFLYSVRARLEVVGEDLELVVVGIAAEDLDRVMEPYKQAHVARAHDHEGTGLGLPLVKSMVELHGGTVELASGVGEGTTITARFPKERVIAPHVVREGA